MFSNKIKRCLLLIMALAAMLSLLTFQIFAAESDTQAEIDRILNDYLGTTTMSPEDISATVAEMDWETYQTARWEISELENSLVASMERGELTEAEAQQLIDRNTVLCNFSDALEEKNASDNEVSLFTTVNVLDGAVSVADTANSNTASGGTVTITAKGSLFSKKTNTVTITNETDSTAELNFSYSASTYNSFTIAGASASASGTHSVILDAGASVTLVLVSNSGFSSTTATLTLSNFSLTAAADASNVTFNYDSTLGSVTVGGTAIASGTTQEVTAADGAALVATANSGIRFLGWIDEADGNILSTETSYTLTPAADMTVKAVFVGANSEPYFGVGASTQKSVSSGLLGMSKIYYYTVSTSYIFDDLNEAAATAAASSTSKAIVLMNDGTLPAGNYTIPSGVTLLIPFDDANSLYTTQALSVGTYTKPTAYRTLTLADGVKLTINGAMSLSAKHRYATASAQGGAPTGAVSFVRMQGNSNITVNNGGALYAYGFITGSGSVTANSGATVYEMFQFTDFRGGTQSTDMENGVFPLSQYYVQNIEVPMTLYSGAKEYAYTTIYMSSADFGTSVAFISNSSGAMFNLTSGYVVKTYDGATDRLIVEVYGDMNLSSINMSIGTGSINSAEYELPINSNITVNVKSGAITINQDLALLPGAKIIVGEGATCTLGSGYNIYIYDADQWGTFCGSVNKKFIPVPYAPGKTYTRTEADLVDASILVNGTVDASAGNAYTTEGGANIYSTGTGVVKTAATGTQTVTYQLVQGTGYTEIPITPAKLKHGDGTYLTSGTNTYVYNNKNSRWECSTEHGGTGHTEAIDAAVPATCTTAGKTEGKHCSVCNKVLVAQEVVAALGHTEVIDEAVAATCTETGLTEGKHCSVCNEVIIAQEVVAALGHTEVIDAAVPATCTTAGKTEGKHCSVCSEVTVEQEEVPALGHTEVTDAAVAATCTATGLTEGKHCSVCNTVTVAQEEVPALGHSYTDVVTPPTFSYSYVDEDGNKVAHDGHGKTVSTCTACGDEQGEVTIAPLAISASLTVTDSLAINIYLPDETVEALQKYYGKNITAKITRTYSDDPNKVAGTTTEGEDTTKVEDDVVKIPITDWIAWTDKTTEEKYERFSYTGIAAKEMIDTIKVEIIYIGEDGSEKSLPAIDSYSVKQYAMKALKTYGGDTAMRTALVDMLNYGAAAQKHFKYNNAEDNLANADLQSTDANGNTYASYATTDIAIPEATSPDNLDAASVSALNNLMYTFYFDLGTQKIALDGLTAEIYFYHYNEEVPSGEEDESPKQRVESTDFVVYNQGQLYGVDVTGLYFMDGRQAIKCILKNAAEEEILSTTDSIEGYIARALSIDKVSTVYLELLKFVDSAKAYFTSQS